VAGGADNQADTTLKLKSQDRLVSLAILIVYSMTRDAPAVGTTPIPSTTPTPSVSSANLSGPGFPLDAEPDQPQTYIGGSKALDALVKLIQATESYFHPSNWGPWTPILARFLQLVTREFHRRWTV
jgi:proteasome activator subunit 4